MTSVGEKKDGAIPVTILTGFLGVGKTTYLNYMIRNGRYPPRTLIFVNDFGAINVDADLIDYQSDRILRFQNGCVCCSLGDSLADQLAATLREEEQPSQIIVEASGVAYPTRIADIARVSPGLMLSEIICVVDAAAVKKQLEDPLVGEVVDAQIRAADSLLINKTRVLSEADMKRVVSELQSLNPHVEWTSEPPSMVPIDQPVCRSQQCDAEYHLPHVGPLVTFSVEWASLEDINTLCELLGAYRDVLVRAKGLLYCAALDPPSIILQYSGNEFRCTPALRNASDCRLVCIGRRGARFSALRELLLRQLKLQDNQSI